MSNLQTYCHLKLDFQKWTNIQGQVVNPRHQTPQGKSVVRLEHPTVEYPSRECKHDIKESEGTMFNPKFTKNVLGRKHLGSCAFAEPKYFATES